MQVRKRIPRRPVLLVAALVVAAGLIGAAVLVPVAGVARQGDGPEVTGPLQPAIPMEQAQQTALAERPGATVAAVGLEFDDGAVVYEITLTDGAEIVIDATTGAVLGIEQDRVQTVTSPAGTPVITPAVSLAEAQRRALDGRDGDGVEEIELHSTSEGLIYEVELSNDEEMTIDAATGAVLETRQDNDDDSDDD